jgi:REP element-mobilizing transposase RayT
MTKFDPDVHRRRSIRLKGYDYSQPGAYFVTICTFQRECTLGEIVEGKMVLSREGEVVEAVWKGIPSHFPNVELDEFILMPNHLHGIIIILGRGKAFGWVRQMLYPYNGDRQGQHLVLYLPSSRISNP